MFCMPNSHQAISKRHADLHGASIFCNIHIDHFVQDCSNSGANALELPQACNMSLIFHHNLCMGG